MPSYLPPYLTKASSSAPSQRQSESISYDYSGQDEINKRRDEASQLAGSRWQALYSGDVAGSVGAGQRIRSLLASIQNITPVRIARIDQSSDFDGGSQSVEGYHESDDQAPARARSMSNILAGVPNYTKATDGPERTRYA